MFHYYYQPYSDSPLASMGNDTTTTTRDGRGQERVIPAGMLVALPVRAKRVVAPAGYQRVTRLAATKAFGLAAVLEAQDDGELRLAE